MINSRLNKFKKYLKNHNLLWSKERREIALEIFKSDKHFTADELLVKMINSGKDISRATIYRTLELLQKSNLISKINLQGSKFIYENHYAKSHHDHMICTKCGKIIEFYSKKIENLQEEICKKYNFSMSGHVMKIYGLCKECQKKEKD